MPKIVIKDNESIENALRRFKKVASETRREVRKHEYHLRPGLRKKEKSKDASKRDAILRKKFR